MIFSKVVMALTAQIEVLSLAADKFLNIRRSKTL